MYDVNKFSLSILSYSFQHLIRIECIAQAVTDVVDGDSDDKVFICEFSE